MVRPKPRPKNLAKSAKSINETNDETKDKEIAQLRERIRYLEKTHKAECKKISEVAIAMSQVVRNGFDYISSVAADEDASIRNERFTREKLFQELLTKYTKEE